MTDKEKVISKIEKEIRLGEHWDEAYRMIDLQLLKDAIELLKEQEPRMMTLDELKQFEDSPCWFESHGTYIGKEGFWIIPAMFHMFPTGMIMSYTSVLNGAGDCGELGLSAYNKTWRCWTSRPTTEQRMVVKWNE